MNLSKSEVIEYIENFLSAKGGDWDWDDFTSIPIDDPYLEKIRIICVNLPKSFPPLGRRAYCSDEGFQYLKRLLNSLKNPR